LFFLVLGGIILVFAQLVTDKPLYESLDAFGAAVAATGPVTLIVWFATDAVYRQEIQRTVGEATEAVIGDLLPPVRTLREIGIRAAYRTRRDALAALAPAINAEIHNSKSTQ
jgi:hypothetical protein